MKQHTFQHKDFTLTVIAPDEKKAFSLAIAERMDALIKHHPTASNDPAGIAYMHEKAILEVMDCHHFVTELLSEPFDWRNIMISGL